MHPHNPTGNPFFWIFMAVLVVSIAIMAWLVISDSRRTRRKK